MNSKQISVPTYLRRIGAVILVASGTAFMLEGWHALTSAQKYSAFLGFSIVLFVMGAICARIWKDSKGARTFLALAAVSLPVHFSQLGAMILSLAADIPDSTLPSLFQLSSTGSVETAILTAVGLVAMLPMAYVGFAAMSRSQAMNLSLIYLLGNTVLLLPTRESHVIGSLVICLLVLCECYEKMYFSKDLTMKTSEGTFARLMLLAPIATLVGRALFYPMDDLFQGVLLLIGAGVFFIEIPRYLKAKNQHLGASQVVGATMFYAGIVRMASFSSDSWFFCHTLACFATYALSFRATEDASKFRIVISYAAAALGVVYLIDSPDTVGSFLVIAVGISLGGAAFALKERHSLFAGIASITAGVVYHLGTALRIATQSPWLSLAILGVSALLLATFFEKRAIQILSRFRLARERFSRWQ